jgi:hypothetical protein
MLPPIIKQKDNRRRNKDYQHIVPNGTMEMKNL